MHCNSLTHFTVCVFQYRTFLENLNHARFFCKLETQEKDLLRYQNIILKNSKKDNFEASGLSCAVSCDGTAKKITYNRIVSRLTY